MTLFFFLVQAVNFTLLICKVDYTFAYFMLNFISNLILYVNYLLANQSFVTLAEDLEFLVKMDMKEGLEDLLERIKGK